MTFFGHEGRAHRRLARAIGKARQTGQAAMGMVIGLVLLLSLSGAMLGATAVQHDPLVSNDVIQHLAYRALQSGIDSYLSAANVSPNLVNCNSGNDGKLPGSTTDTCGVPSSELSALNSWETVTGASSNPVTEAYIWTNAALCFNSACSSVSTTAGQTLQYVKELIYGEAYIGNTISYQSSYVNLVPDNGFLTHIFWSNYESTVPASGQSSNCTYDWNDSYEGPDTTNQGNYGSSNCSAVFFGPNDVLYGPVYTNDSIYVDSSPNFGSSVDRSTVTTHDPNCLFVDPLDNHGSATSCAQATSDVGIYNSATSSDNAQFEPIPSTDTSLETIAAQDGCVYAGPTTITLESNGQMTVTSPDTPYTTSGATHYNQTSGTNQLLNTTNANSCGAGGSSVSPPANGVVYVETVPGSCPNSSSSSAIDYYANPFDGLNDTSTDSQLGYYYGQTSAPDCEGDAFVSGKESGALTIATQNDIVIDGNITYSDCGSSFNSTFAQQCAYNTGNGTTNDVLGLIAFAYVDVDRPVSVTTGYGGTTTSVLPACNGSVAPPLCDPSGGSGLTIDAAILALNDGFGVDNYTTSGTEGTLTVYGTIDEDYRPAVGTFSGNSLNTGYSKYYLWDSRLGYVNVPDYLDPGTPLWEIASTAVNQGVPCTTSTALPGVWTASDNYGSYPNSPGSCASP